ncbi:MAG TPA: GNAT family N-acetyltransferase [Bdellovibrio sp.]|nr:GNAT family N-acetyltransferase [Bdellovibrio sp.]
MKFIKIEDPEEKSRICEKVLRSLPQWFGIESAILDYIKDVQAMETWAAVDTDIIGFISLNKHSQQTAEIHVMGLLPNYHGKKIGSELIRSAEKSLVAQGFKFLTVKTLSPSRVDENYEKTRRFYLSYGFAPIEEFKTLWGEHNPCLMMIKNLAPSSYAVIFTSKRTQEDPAGYEKTAHRMIELAEKQTGFIRAESVRGSEDFGITISYWDSVEDIKKWKAHAEHVVAQELGREKWYESFTTRICRVEHEYSFSKG